MAFWLPAISVQCSAANLHCLLPVPLFKMSGYEAQRDNQFLLDETTPRTLSDLAMRLSEEQNYRCPRPL